MREAPSVLVLGGGPDAEREVSLASASAVASALRTAGFAVHEETIDRPDAAALAAMPGDVVAPILHGRFGEGGPLQDLLAGGGRPYVGAGPAAARLAMDKVASKAIAASLGLAVSPTAVLDPHDPVCPLPLPVVVKPVREGSTVGLFVCRALSEWDAAHRVAVRTGAPTMIEPYHPGRELTVGVVGGRALPVIEIVPAAGLYDYAAKYERDDTAYIVAPSVPDAGALGGAALRLAEAIGAAELARVDFILDADGTPWVLEINTMPGFTDHSLLPMAARAAGAEMPDLWAHLVERAVARHSQGLCA